VIIRVSLNLSLKLFKKDFVFSDFRGFALVLASSFHRFPYFTLLPMTRSEPPEGQRVQYLRLLPSFPPPGEGRPTTFFLPNKVPTILLFAPLESNVNLLSKSPPKVRHFILAPLCCRPFPFPFPFPPLVVLFFSRVFAPHGTPRSFVSLCPHIFSDAP